MADEHVPARRPPSDGGTRRGGGTAGAGHPVRITTRPHPHSWGWRRRGSAGVGGDRRRPDPARFRGPRLKPPLRRSRPRASRDAHRRGPAAPGRIGRGAGLRAGAKRLRRAARVAAEPAGRDRDRVRARVDEDEAPAELARDGAQRPRAGEEVQAPAVPAATRRRRSAARRPRASASGSRSSRGRSSARSCATRRRSGACRARPSRASRARAPCRARGRPRRRRSGSGRGP